MDAMLNDQNTNEETPDLICGAAFWAEIEDFDFEPRLREDMVRGGRSEVSKF